MSKFIEATYFEIINLDKGRVLLNLNRGRLAEESPLELQFSFEHDGNEYSETLKRERGAIKEGVQISLGDFDKVPAKEVFSYFSEDRNTVLVFTDADEFEGLLFEDNNERINHFVGRNGKLFLDRAAGDNFPGLMENRKLTSEVNGVDYWDECHLGQDRNGTRMSGLDMGMAIGHVMYQTQGTSEELLNKFVTLANAIYERQMDISLQIADIYVATEPTFFAPSNCTQDMSTQLSNFRRWETRPSFQPLWHLFDDCFGAFGNTLGIAYVNTMCRSSTSNVGVTQYFDYLYEETEYQTWATFSHEVGHNLAAQHSFEEGQRSTGGIMDYGTIVSKQINGVSQFNTKYRKGEVCANLNGAAENGCLDIGILPRTAPVNDFREFNKPREFTPVDRVLKCAKHSRRVPSVARTLTTKLEETRLECQRACAEDPECAGFTTNGEGWCQLLTSENANTLTYSPNFDTYLCSENELRESLTKLSLDDMLDLLEDKNLKDECCKQLENEGYLGLNYNFFRKVTERECERLCVTDTNCEAASFDKSTTECFLYGGADFSYERELDYQMTSLACNRKCISSLASAEFAENVSTDSSSSYVVGAVFAVAVLVTVGTVVGFRRRTD